MEDGQRLGGDPMGELSWGINQRLAFRGFFGCQLKCINRSYYPVSKGLSSRKDMSFSSTILTTN